MANLNGETPVIRIIKKKGHHGAHHGGAWKVAYADFVTAMLALFIVLWIMAQSQALRDNVAQYFKNPGILPQSQGFMPNSNIGGKMPTPGFSQELQLPSPAPADVVDDQKRLEETKKKIEEVIAQLPELEQQLKDQVSMDVTDEGLRIELMEKENARFFEVGSAKINPPAQKIFTVISKELGVLPNHLTIEGHTDSLPYGSKDYTNWELSTDRANSARRLMGASGIQPHQIVEVRGYADRRLFNAQDSKDYRNRRVSILVRAMDKDKDKLPYHLLPSAAAKKTPPPPPAPLATPVQPIPPKPLPALPPPPPMDAKKAGPAPEAPKAKIAAVQETPPPPPKESKATKGPLEDNLGLQKEIIDLFPKLSPFDIK